MNQMIFAGFVLCTIMERADQYPFGLESNIELFNLYGIDLPSLVNSLPSAEILS